MEELYDFFEKIAANNDRAWFAPRKEHYNTLRQKWIDGMQRATAILAEDWPDVAHADMARNTYRIYRDIRFSNDKSPFKTHIGTTVTPPRLRGTHMGIYVQCGCPDGGNGVWGGIWEPEAPVLKKLRRAIATNDDEFREIVTDPRLIEQFGTGWGGRQLKTAPKGYPKDHPMIEYLRLVDIGKFSEMSREEFSRADWPEALAERMKLLVPLMEFLIYSLEEDTSI